MITKYVTRRQRKELRKNKRKKFVILLLFIILLFLLNFWFLYLIGMEKGHVTKARIVNENIIMEELPVYSGQAYVEVNGNVPYFTKAEMVTSTFEKYSALDKLGRCGTAYANLSKDTMPTEERDDIGMVKPTGWHTVKYPELINDLYLYNRCHLIAFCLAGENANEKNLITGTRYMNIEGMVPFEKRVAEYLDSTDNHVLYRVTPVFEKNNLVANGLLIEAYSVEDAGEGICFCVYCFNVQPGIEIDYVSGKSWSF